MIPIRLSLKVQQVWAVDGGRVFVSAGETPHSVTWTCKAADAPRVGESVGVLLVAHPGNLSLNDALAAGGTEQHEAALVGDVASLKAALADVLGAYQTFTEAHGELIDFSHSAEMVDFEAACERAAAVGVPSETPSTP